MLLLFVMCSCVYCINNVLPYRTCYSTVRTQFSEFPSIPLMPRPDALHDRMHTSLNRLVRGPFMRQRHAPVLLQPFRRRKVRFFAV